MQSHRLTGGIYFMHSVPQGQGHHTILSQVVADIFFKSSDIIINTILDTQKIPSHNCWKLF